MKRLAAAIISVLVASVLLGAEASNLPVPRPRPEVAGRPARAPAEPAMDLSHAMPAGALARLPSTEDQFRALQGKIARDKPAVATAKIDSETLARQAETLRRQLVATATRVETLESEKLQLDADIVRLTDENRKLSASFVRDRVAVARLLAILERLQHDLPPAMALRPDDALSAARGAMLIGASLPEVYGGAAALARRIAALRANRQALVARRGAAVRNAAYLAQARRELDRLLALKQQEASAAASRYSSLKSRLDAVAAQAANLQALLQKVAALRATPATRSIVTVTSRKDAGGRKLAHHSLLCPVAGEVVRGGMDGVGGGAAPGLTYATPPGARVISPADGTVLYAGPYHKSWQVLILEMVDGYDVVLAGLDRLDVSPDDRVLAGEPVGTMSKTSLQPRLYFELRQNGQGMNPAPYIAVALRKAKRS